MALPPARRIATWFGIGLVLIMLAVALAVFFTPTSVLRHIAGTKASAKLGRDFAIDGPVKIDWDWSTPYVHIGKIRLANRPGSAEPDMVSIEQMDFHIKIWKLLEGQLNLPDLRIAKPVIILEKLDEKTKNWDLPALSQANAAAKTALPSRRGNFPIIGALTIEDGKLTYRDKTKDIDVTLAIDTANGGGGSEGAFKLAGKGMLQNQPFELSAQGGSLDMLRNSSAKYPLRVHITMGKTVADVNGTFLDPVQLEGVDTTLALHGASLADLFYLTLIPLPPTPPFQLSGHLLKKGEVWTFEDFKGKVGGSDIEGHLTYDTAPERGFVKAELTSGLLDIKDLAGFTGATPTPRAGDQSSQQQIEKAAQERASSKLLPDVPLDLARLRTTDLNVTLKADRLIAPGLPMNDMNVGFDLKAGVLRIDPLEFGMANGKIKGALVLDATKDVPHAETDLMVLRLSLKQFFKDSRFEPLTTGYIGGHFKLAGDGRSSAEILSHSDGRVTFVMSGGTVSQLIVDAAGLDIGNAAPALLGNDKATGIRCAIGDFAVKDGMLNSQVFVFDTTISNISGEAHVNLKDETIDAKLEAKPKDPTVTAHAPITVSGALKQPSIGLDLKQAAPRGAVAAALSVFLTPIAAIIPFIETGVGEDSDCKALIQQAKAAQAAVPTAN